MITSVLLIHPESSVRSAARKLLEPAGFRIRESADLRLTELFDSPNGLHSAYLNFNAFGGRIWYAGTGGNDDAYEQPFNSLGIVYKYFPTGHLQLEVKLDNILDEEREFEQRNASGDIARILVQDVGTTFDIGIRWTF